MSDGLCSSLDRMNERMTDKPSTVTLTHAPRINYVSYSNRYVAPVIIRLLLSTCYYYVFLIFSPVAWIILFANRPQDIFYNVLAILFCQYYIARQNALFAQLAAYH